MQIAEDGFKAGGPRDVNPLLQSALVRIEELFNRAAISPGSAPALLNLIA